MKRKLEVDIDAVTDKFDAKINGVLGSVKGLGDKLSGLGNIMSLAITAPLLVASKSMIKLASDTEESLNKVNVAFGVSSAYVQEFAKTSLTQFGLAGGTALELASNFGDMATSMGINQKAAAQMSTSLVGLGADLSSFKNIGIDQAKTALTSIFTGETESLKMLGVVMTQANLQAYALSKGFKGNIEDMNESQKVMLRYGYVMEKTKNAQGDFARTGGGAANQMRIFQETLKEIGQSFGSIILPYFTKGLTYINGLMQGFNNLGDEAKTAILVIAGIVATAGPILAISKYVIELGGYLKYLVTPIGLFAIAMGAAAIYTMTHWDKVRQFFYDFEVQFFKFKQGLGTALYTMGIIDAKTAFGDIGDGLKNITRWSEGSKTGVQGFVNSFKGGMKELDALMGNMGTGGKGKGKKGNAFDPTDTLNALGERLKGISENVTQITAEFVEKMALLRDSMKLKDRDGVIKHNEEFVKEAVNGALNNALWSDNSTQLESSMDAKIKNIGDIINKGVTVVGSVFIEQYMRLKQRADDMAYMFADTLKQGITVGLDGLGGLVQAALTKGDKKLNFKRVFSNLLGTIGDLMIELGKKAVMINIVMESIKFPTGATGIALGLGLIAAGGALKAASANMNTNTNSNVNSQKNSTFMPSFGANQLTVNVTGSLIGDGTSLVGTLNNTGLLYGV
jgi:hypothetical protein